MDGGQTWTRESTPQGASDLFPVTCPSARFCMAEYIYNSGNVASVSFPAYVVTDDGGEHWTTAAGTTPDQSNGSPTCAGPSRCYALGNAADLYRSTDAGATWKPLSTYGWSGFDKIACLLRSTCFVVGAAADPQGAIEFGKIVGFGARVLRIATLTSLDVLQIQALSCTSASSCSILGTTSTGVDVIRTSDGGRTWTTRVLPAIHDAFYLSCAGAHHCVVLGARRFTHGPLLALSTDDGGVYWSVRAIATDPYGYSGGVACTATGRCLALSTGVGQGIVLVRPSATSAWSRRSLPTGPSVLSAVACPSISTCVAVGDGSPLYSSDAGATWGVSSRPPPPGTTLGTVACPSSTACVAGGSQPTGGRFVRSSVYMSVDGGATWRATSGVPPDQSIGALACATSTTCVAATTISPGSGPVKSRLLRSTNGGATWTSLTALVPYVTGISCGSSSDCVAVAWDGSVYISSDAGATWMAAADVATTFGSVSCVSSTTCWASGAQPNPGTPAIFSQTVVYLSTDGGTTWSLRTTPDSGGIGDISCTTSTCLLVGTWLGSLESSSDGGTTWSKVTLPSAAPYPSQAVLTPMGRGVLVGGDDLNGAFIATST